jgi:hypothetical protein
MGYLDLETLRQETPSVFAEKPHVKVSDKYTFIPTTEVIDLLADKGWLPTKAKQYISRKDLSSNQYRKHLIRFRNENLVNDFKSLDETLPEIVLFNSHDATSSFRFNIGLFRLVCENGLVVATENFGECRIRHQNYNSNDVIRIINEMTDNFPTIYNNMESMKSKILTDNDVIEYGRIASQNHFGEDRKIDLDGLLKVRRKEDDGNELWKVFNRVQENMLKGGIITSKKVEDRIIVNKTRPIKSVDTNVSLNKMLWGLTEEWL